jgi:cystathionine beta-synthase
VVLLADSVRNYMSKFLNDGWMHENGFVGSSTSSKDTIYGWWAQRRVADLELNSPITITPDVSCREAIEVMTSQAFDMVPVQSSEDGTTTTLIFY